MIKATAAKKRDPERSKEAILTAATAEFAEFGYTGARVDNICSRSGFSKNLVYHYFGGKEELFVEVMAEMYKRFLERQASLSVTGLGPEEGMRALIAHTFQHLLECPEVMSLLNTENLHKASHIRKSKSINSIYTPLMVKVEQLLEQGQKEGCFREGVDPIDLYISISGLGYFYLSNNHTLSFVLNSDLMTPDRLDQRLEHITEMVMCFLSKPSGSKTP